jgi:signal transduction histidine kinase
MSDASWTLPFWTPLPVVLAAVLAVRWPATVAPQRRTFWRRALLIAALPLALVTGQGLLDSAGASWLHELALLTVAAGYLYALIRLDDVDNTGEVFRWTLLLALLSGAAGVIVLSPALGFTVSVCTLLFLGARMPLLWHFRVTLPLVAGNVWLLQAVSGPGAAGHGSLVQALSDGTGLLMMAVFGFILRRATRLGEQLSAANTQLAQHAAQAGELATLRERARLARELHDTLGHALTTITVQLEASERLLERHPERARTLLAQARDLSRSATQDLRLSLSELRPEHAGHSGPDLAAQVQALAGELRAAGLSVQTACDPVALSPQQTHALGRVLREAVQNVRRHAGARHVRLDLRSAPEACTLTVTDDGCGFDPARIPAGHYGLRGMGERLALLGGALHVESFPGGGSAVTARLPLGAGPPAPQRSVPPLSASASPLSPQEVTP